MEKLSPEAHAIQLEKNYYQKLSVYYANLKKLGLEYEHLDYKNSLDFLLMTVQSLNKV